MPVISTIFLPAVQFYLHPPICRTRLRTIWPTTGGQLFERAPPPREFPANSGECRRADSASRHREGIWGHSRDDGATISRPNCGACVLGGVRSHRNSSRYPAESLENNYRHEGGSWLDLSNAFGSILHETIRRVLVRAGVPTRKRDLSWCD